MRVYDFICELIRDGNHAALVDDKGRYRLNWGVAVQQYHELQGRQNGSQKPFNRKDASNKLRGALLNHYAKDGAKEYMEARTLNDRNEVIEREFQMPEKIRQERFGTNIEETSSDVSSEVRACLLIGKEGPISLPAGRCRVRHLVSVATHSPVVCPINLQYFAQL